MQLTRPWQGRHLLLYALIVIGSERNLFYPYGGVKITGYLYRAIHHRCRTNFRIQALTLWESLCFWRSFS